MPHSLQTRYAVTLLGLVLCVVCLLAGVLVFQFRASMVTVTASTVSLMELDLLEQLKKRGELLTRFLSQDLINPVYQQDFETMYDIAKTARDQKDVREIYVYDAVGKVLHDGTKRNPALDQVLTDPISQQAVTTRQVTVHVTKEALEVAAPILLYHECLGGVKVGFSLQGITDEIQTMRHRLEEIHRERRRRSVATVILIALGCSLGGVALAVLVARNLSRPIKGLAQLAARIGHGEYDIPLSVQRSDEIGELTHAFRQMAQDLQRTTVSKDYVNNILNSMLDTLLVVTPEGRIQSGNPAVCRLLGYQPQELIGQPLERIIAGGVLSQQALLGDLLKQGALSNLEMTYLSKDGKAIPVFFSGAVMRGRSGQVQGIVCVAQDMTERKRLERLKEEFIGTVTHELKTPLTIVKVATDVLKNGVMGPLTTAQEDVLKATSINISRLERLLNDFLDFSRLESGQMALDRRRVDTRALIQQAVEAFQPAAHGRQLQLAVGCSPDLPEVSADANRIGQVLQNLLENAVHFARSQVLVKARASEQSVQISVIDDGPGVAAEDMGGLFNKFVQINRPSGGEGYKGTGLGLAICKDIVELHQGAIWAESAPGKGSQFHVVLPRYDENAAKRAVLVRVRQGSDGEKTSLALVALAVSNLEALKAQYGDEALEGMFQTLQGRFRQAAIRKEDTLSGNARRGLMVMLAETNRQGGLAICRRIERLTRGWAYPGQCGVVVPHFKLGLAVYPDDTTDTDQLLEVALQKAQELDSSAKNAIV